MHDRTKARHTFFLTAAFVLGHRWGALHSLVPLLTVLVVFGYVCRELVSGFREMVQTMRAECWHGQEHQVLIEIPDETGLPDAVWFVCEVCGRKTVYTQAQIDLMDLD